MAATFNARATVFGAPARPGLFGKWVHAFSTWRDRQATRKELAKLSDHELDDIGLTRGDIDTMRF